MDQIEDETSNSSGNPPTVYENAKSYWGGVESSINGMLGGFSHLSTADVTDSRRFLRMIMSTLKISQHSRVLDCGSGIGRVSKYVLLPTFDEVDMVDVTQSFLDASVSYIGPALNSKVQRRICSGLQEFVPESGVYSVIWIQWVAGQLTDDDLVSFLRRCRSALKFNEPSENGKLEGGIIVLKENMASSEERDFDEEDNSWTRSYKIWQEIFQRADLRVIKEKKQTNFPKEMYEVRMFALL